MFYHLFIDLKLKLGDEKLEVRIFFIIPKFLEYLQNK